MYRNLIVAREDKLVETIKINNYIIKKYKYPSMPKECIYLLLNNPSIIEIKAELKNIEHNHFICRIIAIVPETHMILLNTLFEDIILICDKKLKQIEDIISNHNTKTEARKISFTLQEEMFLKEIAFGLNNKEIAYELTLSDRSVRRIKEKLLSKTGLSSTQQLTLYAINKGY